MSNASDMWSFLESAFSLWFQLAYVCVWREVFKNWLMWFWRLKSFKILSKVQNSRSKTTEIVIKSLLCTHRCKNTGHKLEALRLDAEWDSGMLSQSSLFGHNAVAVYSTAIAYYIWVFTAIANLLKVVTSHQSWGIA